jgi:hypothetical protein
MTAAARPSHLDAIPAVCFIEDLTRWLGVSRTTIERLRRHDCFPIPEIPSLDKRPRWAGLAVRRFIEQGDTGQRLRRAG